jgi:energy-coupling factor transporter ATP-binding protein EcfA2
MFLEKLSVRNLRSLGSAELDFIANDDEERVRKWSLLVGENGTGKSTILKAIALILAGSDELPFLLGDPQSWVRQGTKEAVITARLRTADWGARDVELVIGAEDHPREVYNRNEQTLAALDSAIRNASQNYFVVGYGPYRRVADSPTLIPESPSRPARAQSVMTLFDRNAVVNPLPAWAMSVHYELGDEGLEIVRDALDTLLPGVAFQEIDRRSKTLLFRTADGVVPLEQLSDGYQNVAVWIGDLLYRVNSAFAHRKRPLEARGLLLIDEVDAHLHPAWQRQLRQFLDTKLPNFQIVATTHSALTLQQAHEGDATVLSRDESRVVRAKPFPGDPSKLRLHQLYDLAFRIGSLDSWEIEQAKDVYRTLHEKDQGGGLSLDEQARLKAAADTLEAVPDEPADGMGNPVMDAFLRKVDDLTSSLQGQIRP